MSSFRIVAAILAITVAYLYQKWKITNSELTKEIENDILIAWDKIIKAPARKYKRVTLGVNANVDLVVNGTALLRQLKVEPGLKRDHPLLDTIEHLQETFHLSLSRGAAIERFFTNPNIFLQIAQAATELEDTQWAVGGNAALMAQKISQEFPGTDVQLIGPIGPRLQDLLYKGIKVPSYSTMPDDEIHLIMEYSAGERWGASVAPVATRFITSSDGSNSKMSHLEAFCSSFPSSHPDLIIFSGLHMLEGQSEQTWKGRIENLLIGLDMVPKGSPIHLELASMADPKFVGIILDQVVPYVDSIGANEQELFLAFSVTKEIISKVNAVGLNEQEMAFASFAGGGPHFDLRDEEGQPPVHKITDIMVWLLKKYGHSVHRPDSKLTRVHFHCLTYHIIGTVAGQWQNVKSAVAMGARTAGKQACDTNNPQASKFTMKMPRHFKLSSHPDLSEEVTFNASQPVIVYEVQGYEFYLSPVLVCDKPLKTVGLGDAISSMALMYSSFNV